jgi:carbamoyl-phosphate synthase large subunit
LGSGLIKDEAELVEAHKAAAALAPDPQIMVEKFLEGWREFELEVMRDRADNCVVVCSMENVDPMGVHTGDSVTVAPVQTLTDKEYQQMRAMAFTCIRAVGVDTGGANVQFALHPETGEWALIEMNPRVSRSSALASKATGFPIAAIATELALGATLDQIPNEITGKTTAAFEPSLDYVVIKIPQFQFAKFEVRHPWLGTSMKSVGEAMAIGRTFCEAAQKGWRALEEGHEGLDSASVRHRDRAHVLEHLRKPNPYRLLYVKEALLRDMAVGEIARLTNIHPWFIGQIERLVRLERSLKLERLDAHKLAEAKKLGYSDKQLAALTGLSEEAIARRRRHAGLSPEYCEVDTCAGEFEAQTPYFYSTYHVGTSPKKRPGSKKKRYLVFGSGPNRIGEGLEFDYSCVHASQAIQEAGHEAILINSNPETVSTDYDVSTRLYFEPVHAEAAEELLRWEKPEGVILQFGGQAPLNLATRLKDWPILGTPVASIVRTEDRSLFADALKSLGIPYPRFAKAAHKGQVLAMARRVGFPILVRPSFVMGGDRIKIFRDAESLTSYLEADHAGGSFLVDRFLNPASELDVDAVSDGKKVRICGILEHIEPAGIHSGDSSMVYPPVHLKADSVALIQKYLEKMARAFRLRGLFNLQLAVYGGQPFIIELNARASRTVPFLSKATGIPWAKVATRVLLGQDLDAAMRPYAGGKASSGLYYAKASAFCFYRFPGPPPGLGPEMRSTGETMGIADTPEEALAKARLSAGQERLAPKGPLYCLQDL